MNLPTVYFDVNHALAVHDWIIEQSGGMAGVKDQGQLESVLTHIQNDDYYPAFPEKLSHLVFGINKFHAFNDGNKRSSLVLGAYFLTINGYEYCVEPYMLLMENIVVAVAENKVNKDLLCRLLISILEEGDFSEALKLELLLSLGGID